MTADRYYPVVIQLTQHRVMWVKGESAADARASINPSPYAWEEAEETAVSDYDDLSVRDDYLAGCMIESITDEDEIGPCEACPECGAVADWPRDWSLRHARHRKGCSSLRHYLSVSALWAPDYAEQRGIIGWYLECTCDEPGFERVYGDARHNRMHVFRNGRVITGPDDKSELAAIAQAHVAGRPHHKNLTLGILDDLEHADPRRRKAAAVTS